MSRAKKKRIYVEFIDYDAYGIHFAKILADEIRWDGILNDVCFKVRDCILSIDDVKDTNAESVSSAETSTSTDSARSLDVGKLRDNAILLAESSRHKPVNGIVDEDTKNLFANLVRTLLDHRFHFDVIKFNEVLGWLSEWNNTLHIAYFMRRETKFVDKK